MKRFLLFLIAAGLAYGGWRFRDQLVATYREVSTVGEAQAVPDPERYQVLKQELELKRSGLAHRYASARTAGEIQNVRNEAKQTLEATLPEMMRCWLGTEWDFNGTAQIPGEGKIACGYFVSTVMRDAGFQVERIHLAQQPSQNIIRTFLPRHQMHIEAGLSYDRFLEKFKSHGPGIHIVGLDRHVAFIVVSEDGELRFIHSSGGAAKCVVDQDQRKAHALRKSKYRVTGNISRSDDVIHQWLTKEKWKTVQ
ncbi:hypothetical protein N9124_02155 [bacterium]|nr:hypothetical protein [Akkermansiaceae bacterium]MDB4266129.1 hypothetical protein [bacterium]MDA7535693.1 hypothetical protein [Akkermansiaceae bacterium]MDA7537653.1 hypothetical protein [Akkermansiaceae bacterium]MDA7649412.1 hypothetical protein [Akkermansiaceae bacterium]